MMSHMKSRLCSAGFALLLASCGDPTGSVPDPIDGEEPTLPLPTEPEVPGLSPRNPRPDVPFAAGPARVRRLLDGQYENAVRALVGDVGAGVALPPTDVPLNGFFAVGAAELALSGNGVDAYEASAVAIAAAASIDAASPARAICQQATPACFEQITRTLGRRRRRLRGPRARHVQQGPRIPAARAAAEPALPLHRRAR